MASVALEHPLLTAADCACLVETIEAQFNRNSQLAKIKTLSTKIFVTMSLKRILGIFMSNPKWLESVRYVQALVVWISGRFVIMRQEKKRC